MSAWDEQYIEIEKAALPISPGLAVGPSPTVVIMMEGEAGEDGLMRPPGTVVSSSGSASPMFWMLPFAAAHG